MIVDDLVVSHRRFETGTGWTLNPQGACRGAICVPLGDAVDGDRVHVAAAAERLGMPIVHDASHGLWAIGPWTEGGRALPTAEAAELTLPDLDGNEFSLSSLRGRKVLLLAWAPY